MDPEIEKDWLAFQLNYVGCNGDLPYNEPGGMGCHEAFHTVALISDTVTNHLLAHPSIIENHQWFEKAWRIRKALDDLYRTIGRDHQPDG